MLESRFIHRRNNMKKLFIISTSSAAGKTTIGLSIALTASGVVGYFKPFSLNDDAHVFHRILKMPDSPEMVTQDEGNIVEQFNALADKNDMIIIEGGPNLSYGAYKNLSSVDIAHSLDVEPVIIAQGSTEVIVDKLSMAQSCFPNIKGVIINKISHADLKELKSFTIPLIEDIGIPVIGTVPSYKTLRMFTAHDIVAHLHAEIVNEEGLENGIDTMLVGAMSFDAALTYFRRYADKVVVTGGDRAEIMLAAMETSTACIVATGGVRPSPPVIKKAVELKIPILMVKGDTYSAAKTIQNIQSTIRPEDNEKIALIKNEIPTHIQIDSLLHV
jgi:BioD-like phosphotransacetylase family protein